MRYVILPFVIAFAVSSGAQVISPANEKLSDPIGPAHNTSAAPESIRHTAAAWELLDIAREEFMQGKATSALGILEELAADSATTDTNFMNARRELTAFVLALLGEHQRAFDTLQLFVNSRLDLIDKEAVKREEDLAAQINELKRKGVLQEQEAQTRERELQEQHEEYFYITVILIVLLLLICILLLIKVVRRSRTLPAIQVHNDARATEVPEVDRKEKKEAPVEATARIDPAEPLDPRILLAHTEHISGQLNKGATVEAAGHLGILNRFLKIISEEKGRSLPAQSALALFRQYLKLEVLRSNVKVKYSVDADRSLIDTGATVPAVPILYPLSYALHSAAASGAAMLNVELVPSASGNGLQCVIAHPAGTAHMNVRKVTPPSDVDLRITEAMETGKKVIRIEWIEPSAIS